MGRPKGSKNKPKTAKGNQDKTSTKAHPASNYHPEYLLLFFAIPKRRCYSSVLFFSLPLIIDFIFSDCKTISILSLIFNAAGFVIILLFFVIIA